MTVHMPLFPGYVFVRMALRDKLRVQQVPGVARLVGFDGTPAALPESAPSQDAAEAIAAAHEALQEAAAQAESAEGSGEDALDGLAPVSAVASADAAGSDGAVAPA